MDDYQVILFFYNPNIWPSEEWQRRLDAAQRLAAEYKLPLLVDDSGISDWLAMAEPLAGEPERSRRCQQCYQWRLSRAARRADQEGCALFATSLTVSPYKDTLAINASGQLAAQGVAAEYLATDFQQNDGYRQSIELSRRYGLYRQKYCGCQFAKQ